MEVTQVYAIAAAALFLCLSIFRIRRYIQSFLKTAHLQASQHLIYPQLIYRQPYVGPWSRADVLLQLSYIAINVFCIAFKASSIRVASLRAADLTLINIIVVFAGPHLSFLADILGLSLTSFRRLHRSFGLMSCFLLSFHVFTMIGLRVSFPLRQAENLWGVIVSLFPSLFRLFQLTTE